MQDIIRRLPMMFLGKSAHGAADTDMAGLLGQLQVLFIYISISIKAISICIKIAIVTASSIVIATEAVIIVIFIIMIVIIISERQMICAAIEALLPVLTTRLLP